MMPRAGQPLRGQLALPVALLAEPAAGPRPEPLPVLHAPVDWMARAACAHDDAAYLPWTTDRDDLDPAATAAMAEVCETCPVLVHCRGFLKPAGITAGYWAGQHRDKRWPTRRNAGTRQREDQGAA
jgi:hypothetical protein